jgi:hypothetical protein
MTLLSSSESESESEHSRAAIAYTVSLLPILSRLTAFSSASIISRLVHCDDCSTSEPCNCRTSRFGSCRLRSFSSASLRLRSASASASASALASAVAFSNGLRLSEILRSLQRLSSFNNMALATSSSAFSFEDSWLQHQHQHFVHLIVSALSKSITSSCGSCS